MSQVTIKDVARHAGVSFQTVSLVLNHPEKVAKTTRETIEATMRNLDFVPSLAARTLRKKSSKSIACVFSVGAQPYDAVSGFMQETYQGIVLQTFAHVTDRYGYTLIHRRWHSEEPDGISKITALVTEARVDGIIVLADRRDDPLIAALQAKKFRFFVFGLDVPNVSFAMRAEGEAVRQVVGHLAATGCRSICLFKAARDGRQLPSVEDRLAGYREALAAAGLPFRDELVVASDWNSESGYRTMHRLLDQGPRMDAIVAANDRVAFGILKALHERGVRVPHDISVVGFDNFVQCAYTVPSLTSIENPTLDMVECAVSTLIEMIEGTRLPDDSVQKSFPTRLVLRDSTYPIRQV